MLCVPKLKTKIYIVSFSLSLALVMFMFCFAILFEFVLFAQSLQSVISVYYLVICFCCFVLILLSNTRYSLRSFFCLLFMCECVNVPLRFCVHVCVFTFLCYHQMVCCDN